MVSCPTRADRVFQHLLPTLSPIHSLQPQITTKHSIRFTLFFCPAFQLSLSCRESLPLFAVFAQNSTPSRQARDSNAKYVRQTHTNHHPCVRSPRHEGREYKTVHE